MTDPSRKSVTYRDAGVDIDAGEALVDRIKPMVRRTHRPEVLGGIGGFGALVELPVGRWRRPVLVSGTDGVGTKLRLAIDMGRHQTIGIDLVAMCANDVAVCGAEPLFFLDYYATGRLSVPVAASVIEGIAEGCVRAGCALVGGETAEMPGLYQGDDYDLAGFCVGVVEKEAILDGHATRPGDLIIGMASSGAHSNGYSLIRRILARAKPDLAADFHGRPLRDAILAPTRIYVKPLLKLLAAVPVKGLAHITGGGLVDNVPRILPDGVMAELTRAAWPRFPLFDWLQREGNVDDAEMHRVFNCGIGMVLVIAPGDADAALKLLAAEGEQAFRIGTIRARSGDEAQTTVV